MKKENGTFEGLPNITEQLAEVIRHYDESLENAFESFDSDNIGGFVDAWLVVQKQQAIRLYFQRKRLAKEKLASLASVS